MQIDGDSKIWGAIGGLIAMMVGWLHLRSNKNEDFIKSLSEKLSEHYMTREQVKEDIKDAREEFRRDIDMRIEPIKKQLDKVEQGIDFLVKFHLDEKK